MSLGAPSHTALGAERQEQASEGPQPWFPGPGCHTVGQGDTGREAGFQISAAFREVQDFIFSVLPPTQKTSLSSRHLGVTASAHAGGH